MKLYFNYFQKTVLHIALKSKNIQIIKLLLSYKNLDVNIPYVFKKTNFNKIQKFFYSNNILN